MSEINVFDGAVEYDPQDPPGYRAGAARIATAAMGRDTAMKLFEIPPGEAICPYHYEYEEEWLLVLEGDLVVRTPAGESPAVRGDLIYFAKGPDGAHKVRNDGGASARALMFSPSREPSFAVYPDSDKIGVWPGRDDDHVILRRADGHVDYYDGELG